MLMEGMDEAMAWADINRRNGFPNPQEMTPLQVCMDMSISIEGMDVQTLNK
jgi:hypothetical protein